MLQLNDQNIILTTQKENVGNWTGHNYPDFPDFILRSFNIYRHTFNFLIEKFTDSFGDFDTEL